MISKFGLEFQKFFSISRTNFFLTVGRNNFGNKIPFLVYFSDNFNLDGSQRPDYSNEAFGRFAAIDSIVAEGRFRMAAMVKVGVKNYVELRSKSYQICQSNSSIFT